MRSGTHRTNLGQTLCRAALALAIAACLPAYEAAAQTPATSEARTNFDIPAGDLSVALEKFSTQSGIQVVYAPDLLEGKRAAAVVGQQTWQVGLEKLLAGSGLVWSRVNSTTVAIKAAASPKPVAPPESQSRRAVPVTDEEAVKNMPAIMVTGTKTLNMDITRTEDDPQPYVVFDREQIERSGATSLEQFLQQRLTMNTSTVNNGSAVATSRITLRGLSAAQTLILVDGHRVSSAAWSSSGQGSLTQADISGIPLAAIERIEVLPTTASGIYGGSATGGVINIIMRRDYAGAEVKFTYDNSFNTDTATRQLDVLAGYNFNQGKTNLLVTANYSDANDLRIIDRDLVQRGRTAMWNHSRSRFLGPSGMPPLGATPNITSSDGSNLELKSGATLNSSFTSVPAGYAGPSSDGGAAFIENSGIYNWKLPDTAQAGGARQALYTRPIAKSGNIVLRHQFHDRLNAFAELASSRVLNKFPASAAVATYRIPESSPSNPFAQDIQVTAPIFGSDSVARTEIDHDRLLVGATAKIFGEWQLGADYTWDRTTVTYEAADSVSLASAVNTGEVDILKDWNAHPLDISPYIAQSLLTSPFESTLTDTNFRVSGPLVTIPGGKVTLSASLAHRREVVPDSFQFRPTSNLTTLYPERSQSVTSAYMELGVPLFSERNSRPGLRSLELQIAVRRDNFTSRSGEELTFRGELPTPLPDVKRSRNSFVSTDPTIALKWNPIRGLALRASYGTGFLPPPLNQLVPNTFAIPVSIGLDPLRGNTPAGPYTLILGGSSELEPEQSKSWSAGFIVTPLSSSNFRLSVDYTRIEKSDNIGFHPGAQQGLINDEAIFPGRVIRGQSLPGDLPGWAGPITVLDLSAMNLARTVLDAWDVQVDFRKETDRFGAFDMYFAGTWQPRYEVQTIRGQPLIDNVGIGSDNPLKFKGNAGLVWTNGNLQARWNASHFGSYKVGTGQIDIDSQGNRGKVPSQTYHDVSFTYSFGMMGRGSPGWMDGLEVTFGVRNIFNKRPPLDAINPYIPYSKFGDPRLSTYFFSAKKIF